MITVLVSVIVFGVVFYIKSEKDMLSALAGVLIGLFVGLILALIIGVCLPARDVLLSTKQLEPFGVGNGNNNYYVEEIEATEGPNVFIYQINGQIMTTSGGGGEIIYENTTEPYVEFRKSEVVSPKWTLWFGFGKFIHNYPLTKFYVPKVEVYLVDQ